MTRSFQSAPLTEARGDPRHWLTVSTFQSTPPHGGRRSMCGGSRSARSPEFQSTPPHGGRLSSRSIMRKRTSGKCFNPRPRTGGDCSSSGRSVRMSQYRFNPRPRTGGDIRRLQLCASVIKRECFNPRPRTGGDLQFEANMDWEDFVPFQSTPPHGGRHTTYYTTTVVG